MPSRLPWVLIFWREHIFPLEIVLRGTWVAQLVKHPTSAQVMISQLMSLSPASGFVLTSQSLEPALDSVSPSLSLPLRHSSSVFLKNKHFKKKIFLIEYCHFATINEKIYLGNDQQ